MLYAGLALCLTHIAAFAFGGYLRQRDLQKATAKRDP